MMAQEVQFDVSPFALDGLACPRGGGRPARCALSHQ
jgi:hypothetical protein